MLDMLNFIKCRCNRLRGFNLFMKNTTCLSLGSVRHESTAQVLPLRNVNEEDDIQKKIIHNTKLSYEKFIGRRKKFPILNDVELQSSSNKTPPVIALKYFNSTDENCRKTEEELAIINLPYGRHTSVQLHDLQEEEVLDAEASNVYNSTIISDQDLPFIAVNEKSSPKSKWMTDYNKYVEVSVKQLKAEKEASEERAGDGDSWKVNYGSADPNYPSSSVPCGGCGAHLHCQDPGIPGYLPKELFAQMSTAQLQAVVCQRCHFLREYDTALSVNVDPQLYPKMLSQLRGKTALVILVVDMTDFPCSIWPGILNVIGPKRPLVIVGNKTDLLRDWSKNMLDQAKESLLQQLPARANVLHAALVSAKTGFGIEELVTSLYKMWEYRGDVYLVGCTNVGKSSLFNALLQSDYCKTKAVDLMQRATTAPWPGTTLNLLKFPIMRPEGWRLAMRSHRLSQQKVDFEDDTKLCPQIISNINRTFSHGKTDKYTDDYWDDPFAIPKLKTLKQLKESGSGLDPSDPEFINSKWLFDTPGVVTPDQIIDLLTTEELMLTLPRQAIVPRSFVVWAGQSLLVGGLGRLDYISGTNNIKMTVLAAPTLPVTICLTSDVEAVYSHYLGSELLAVPRGSKERLNLWPGLHAGPTFSLRGDGWKVSCADVVLSSAGWIAVTSLKDSLSELQAWTPHARGIYVRMPPVLPRAVAVKGRRMYKSQAYALFNEYIDKPKQNS